MARLGEICEKKIDAIKSTYAGNIDYIDISSIDNQRKEITQTQKISFKEAPSRAKQLVFPGDILVSTVRPNLNAVALITENSDNILVASTGYCVLRCLPNVDQKYVFYFCQSPAFVEKLVMQATGASYPAVTSNIVKECIIPLPSLAEQRKIAAVLDKVSDLIAKRRQQLDKLDEMVKARFVEMFGDCYTNPHNLPIEKWNNIFSTTTGKLDSNAAVENGKFPFFTCSKETLRIDTYAFDQEALLLAGNNAAGKYDVKYYCGKFNAYQRTYVLSLKHDWSYALFRFQLEDKLGYLEQQSLGGLTKYLTLKILNELEFIVPPKEEQDKFAAYVDQIEKTKTTVSHSLEKLEALKKALMQKYFK